MGGRIQWMELKKVLIIFQLGLANVMHGQIGKLYRFDGDFGFDDHGIMFTNLIYSLSLIWIYRYFYKQTQFKIIDLIETLERTIWSPRLHQRLVKSLGFLRYFLRIINA
jgi:hypothetical protein